MKSVIVQFLLHKDLYILSASVGTVVSYIVGTLTQQTPVFLFGINASLWLIALIINIVDIHTGIKADTKRKEKSGEKFSFESGKAWRAFEKIFIFTMIIWFIYTLETECLRLQLYSIYSSTLLLIKFVLLIYVVLIELQSIGENQEDIVGKKSKLFIMLDRIISIVNEGVYSKLKKSLDLNTEE
jgi:MFS family permease